MQKLQQLSNLFITPNMIILRKQQASNTSKKTIHHILQLAA